MGLFILSASPTKTNEEAFQHMDAHLDFLEDQFKKGTYFMFAQKVLLEGGVCIAAAPSLEAMKALVAQDPLVVHGVAQFSFQEINPTRISPAIANFSEKKDHLA
ncbi:hypothetical protein IFR04_015440 [Cadophora malorum]|uniref:YCII-related domain-containing protein n=1 Tax=Cadophora malorum TaxID=108018 RepID=A0A8H7W5B9_9HELO|nr:hypothetical protein IFR04_015440 [Cadophora malorum]